MDDSVQKIANCDLHVAFYLKFFLYTWRIPINSMSVSKDINNIKN